MLALLQVRTFGGQCNFLGMIRKMPLITSCPFSAYVFHNLGLLLYNASIHWHQAFAPIFSNIHQLLF
jgi:hypothetical protein